MGQPPGGRLVWVTCQHPWWTCRLLLLLRSSHTFSTPLSPWTLLFLSRFIQVLRCVGSVFVAPLLYSFLISHNISKSFSSRVWRQLGRPRTARYAICPNKAKQLGWFFKSNRFLVICLDGRIATIESVRSVCLRKSTRLHWTRRRIKLHKVRPFCLLFRCCFNWS